MKNYRILRLLLIGLITFFLANACTRAPFTIEDEKFVASDICDAEGKFKMVMHRGKLASQALTGIKVHMIKDGLPSPWCHGVKHVWVGKATHGGYTFQSSADDPLQFVVDRNKGYYYEKGKGTVTTPNGKVIQFP